MFLPTVLLALSSLIGTSSQGVDFKSLLAEMTDLNRLAKVDAPVYSQKQASSYDRKQTDPAATESWFANEDYGQFIRKEQHGTRSEWVVLEANGPGAITRIWTPLLADKDKMIVRFYFDGSDQPAIEENFNDLMRGKGRIHPPFVYVSWPDASVQSGVGADCYLPIPYKKGCKVTFSESPFYYAFGYRAYAEGTAVTTFSWPEVDRLTTQLAHTAKFLQQWHPLIVNSPGSRMSFIKPGKAIGTTLIQGDSAISEIQVTVDKNVDPQVLRSTAIVAIFDGEASVWCPIGEFFGCGVALKPVWDQFRQVSQAGVLSARFPMPFKRSAKLQLVNFGKTPVHAGLQVRTTGWNWNDESMHFHSTWRMQDQLATIPRSDWNYIEAKGTGRYVGDTLTVMSPSPAWYGEGDERIYVDGEHFPSTLGTGTEDYYGYAWGMAEKWSSAYMSMPVRDKKGRENWSGYTTTSRVRGLDDVPFQKSLKFDMEVWDWADCKVAYSASTFWYARPGAHSNRYPDYTGVRSPIPLTDLSIKGAIECEGMTILHKSPDTEVSSQNAGLVKGSWSQGEQLFLQNTAPGQSIELAFNVAKAGRYVVTLYATKSNDYGQVKVSINGSDGTVLDLYDPKPIASGPINLGEFQMSSGRNSMKVTTIGTNPKATGFRYFVGLDCLVLVPIR